MGVASLLKFVAADPRLQAMVPEDWAAKVRSGQAKISLQPGSSLGGGTELVYTTDAWTSTRVAQFREDSINPARSGFVLRDVQPGTRIEGAIHADLVLTDPSSGYSLDRMNPWIKDGPNNFFDTAAAFPE